MSAVAWRDWHAAFEDAGKSGDQRLTFVLEPPAFAKALLSLDQEHGWLMRSDPRYQQACATGRLEWWDGRGRCVVLMREGSRDSGGEWARGMTPAQAKAADVAAGLLPPDQEAFDRAAATAIKAAEERAIVAEARFPDPPQVAAQREIAPPIISTPISERENQDIKPPLLVGPPPPAPGVDLGLPKTSLEPIKGKGKKK